MTRLLAAFGLIATLMLAAPAAEACSCLPPTVQSSYRNHDNAFTGRAMSETIYGQWRVTDFLVTRDIKSCLPTGRIVRVATPVQSATCGTRFRMGQQYLVFASNGSVTTPSGTTVRVMTTNICAGNRTVTSLTRDEVDWLRTRFVPCTGTCVDPNVPVYNCLVDPCTTVPACAQGTCEANYCGGCIAEFYDSFGYQVCTP